MISLESTCSKTVVNVFNCRRVLILNNYLKYSRKKTFYFLPPAVIKFSYINIGHDYDINMNIAVRYIIHKLMNFGQRKLIETHISR